MNVLVLGANGTLGQPLVRELIARGHDVTQADLMHGRDMIRTDIREARQVDALFEMSTPVLVYNLAAEFGRLNGGAFPEQLWTSNCLGLTNVVRASIRHDAHLVHASSSEAYGDGADLMGLITEDRMLTHVPSFANEYALTKWTNEKQIEIARTYHGLKATVLRFFNVYGPGEYYNTYRSVVCQFVYRMLHDLPVTIYEGGRDFLYVDDWARTVGNLAFVDLKHMDGEYINIGSNDYANIERLATYIAVKTGYDLSKANYKGRERANVQNKRPDIERACKLLGHACQVSLHEGLDRTIAWMRAEYGK